MATDDSITELLDALSKAVMAVIVRQVRKKALQPELESKPLIQIEGFAYNEKGPTYTGSSHGTQYQPDWMRAVVAVSALVWPLPEYTLLENYIAEHYDCQHPVELQRQYAYQLMGILLKNPLSFDLSVVARHREKLIRTLNDAPHPVKVTVYLSGLILSSPEIIIDERTRLRQTLASDIEQQKHHGSGDVALIAFPSAVLEINCEVKKAEFNSFYPLVARYVRLLRLFRSGSVNNDFYQIVYDTITAPKRTSGGGGPPIRVWQQYLIKETDEAQLLSFLRGIQLPTKDMKQDYLSTAYERYSEALLESVAIERRITNAIMGLEALLSDDNAELTFRLSNRAARMLGFFNFEALTVRCYLAKAYAIRSKYAHGGFLDETQRKKIERDFQPIEGFALTIIDYVRVLYLISALSKLSKAELLRLVDDSFIDDDQKDKLQLALADLKTILPN